MPGPTTPSTMVPRTPIEATGVLIASREPERPVRPETKRKAPRATVTAEPLFSLTTKRSTVIRALAPTVKVERSRSSTWTWLCGPVTYWSPRRTGPRSWAGRKGAFAELRTWTEFRIAALTPTESWA